jgi:hypothetical protein
MGRTSAGIFQVETAPATLAMIAVQDTIELPAFQRFLLVFAHCRLSCKSFGSAG